MPEITDETLAWARAAFLLEVGEMLRMPIGWFREDDGGPQTGAARFRRVAADLGLGLDAVLDGTSRPERVQIFREVEAGTHG